MTNLPDNQYELTYIVQDIDRNYRWTYDIDSSTNKSMLKTYMLIFALVILIPGVIMFFVIYGHNIATGYWSGTGAYLGILLAVFLGAELLTVLIYNGIEKLKGGTTPVPYLMNEEGIIVHPGNEWTPKSYLQTFFSDVKDIKLDLNSDLILLYEPLRVSHVYVPREDMSFVLNYIIDRIPQNERFQKLRIIK